MLTVSLKALFMFPVSLLSVPPLFANLCLLFITFQSFDINKLADLVESFVKSYFKIDTKYGLKWVPYFVVYIFDKRMKVLNFIMIISANHCYNTNILLFLNAKIPYQILLYMIKMVYSGRYIIIGSYRTIFKKTSYRLNRRLFADIIR